MDNILARPNKCVNVFICTGNRCAYKTDNGNGGCKYESGYVCNSKVAQVNRSVLFLKEQGVWPPEYKLEDDSE